jgi:hypothetical protein
MERGPVALFGAIVAVGLGPAMWLGAQFGTVALTPNSPPAATSGQDPSQSHDTSKGGGAGSAPEDPSVVLETRPRANYRPLHQTPSASPSATRATTTPTPDQTTSDATTTPTPSAEPSSAPTESTTQPTDPPTGSTGDAPPPSPPPTSSNQDAHTSDV